MAPRSKTEPQCGLTIAISQGEPVIFLTVPEDSIKGERVVIWTSPEALRRLADEIYATLGAL